MPPSAQVWPVAVINLKSRSIALKLPDGREPLFERHVHGGSNSPSRIRHRPRMTGG